MDDLISREKVLNTISFIRKCCDTNDIDDYENMLVEAFQVLPPAQTIEMQNKEWEWNNEYELFYSCPYCKYKAYGSTAEIMAGVYKYCPHCGKRLDS